MSNNQAASVPPYIGLEPLLDVTTQPNADVAAGLEAPKS